MSFMPTGTPTSVYHVVKIPIGFYSQLDQNETIAAARAALEQVSVRTIETVLTSHDIAESNEAGNTFVTLAFVPVRGSDVSHTEVAALLLVRWSYRVAAAAAIGARSFVLHQMDKYSLTLSTCLENRRLAQHWRSLFLAYKQQSQYSELSRRLVHLPSTAPSSTHFEDGIIVNSPQNPTWAPLFPSPNESFPNHAT